MTIQRMLRAAAIAAALCSTSAAPLQTPSGVSAEPTAWFCPMHPEVTSTDGGRCRKCGMAFVQGDPFDTREYVVDVATAPAAVRSGVSVTMTLTVRHPGTGDPITKFETVHERRYHLFVISRDMEVFEHLHPEQRTDGRWEIQLTLPKPGYYQILSDFLPGGGASQFIGHTLVTADFDGDLESQAPRLLPDTGSSKNVGSINAYVQLEPPILVAGEYGHLSFTLTDAVTGQPVTDLQPYLGSFGHTLILSEDMADYVHSHPYEGSESINGDTPGGPRVTFEGYMPRAGRYRAWTQFLRRGELVTVPFTFRVSTVDEAVGAGR